MRRVLAVFFLITVCASNAFAWGEEGHRIVCRIAFLSLSTGDQEEVARLTKAYKTPPHTDLMMTNFPDACVFPDEARRKARKANTAANPWFHFKPFDKWHFLNVARSVKTISENACHTNCVFTGITRHSGLLQNGPTDQDRAEGLIFLGHWVGDIHQPLHVSYEQDQGGNTIQPITGDFYPIPKDFPLNLHSVWDSSIIGIEIAEPGWRKFADDLHAKVTDAQRTAWTASKPLKWAQESYDITTLPDVEYCKKNPAGCESFGTGRVLKQPYQTEFADDVNLRLQEAGTRLAALIHTALHP
jgi:hypothetical protein